MTNLGVEWKFVLLFRTIHRSHLNYHFLATNDCEKYVKFEFWWWKRCLNSSYYMYCVKGIEIRYIVTSEQIQKWKNITYYMFYNRNYICTTYVLTPRLFLKYRTWNLLRTFTIKEAAIVSINLYAFDKPQDSLIYKH